MSANEPVVWKAYDEVHFSDQYILRWVREGDEYVNRISKEMMEDLQTVVRQQAEKINNLEQWQRRHLDVIEAQKEYMKAQDEKIVDLAFKLVYAERGNEVAKELSNERK